MLDEQINSSGGVTIRTDRHLALLSLAGDVRWMIELTEESDPYPLQPHGVLSLGDGSALVVGFGFGSGSEAGAGLLQRVSLGDGSTIARRYEAGTPRLFDLARTSAGLVGVGRASATEPYIFSVDADTLAVTQSHPLVPAEYWAVSSLVVSPLGVRVVGIPANSLETSILVSAPIAEVTPVADLTVEGIVGGLMVPLDDDWLVLGATLTGGSLLASRYDGATMEPLWSSTIHATGSTSAVGAAMASNGMLYVLARATPTSGPQLLAVTP